MSPNITGKPTARKRDAKLSEGGESREMDLWTPGPGSGTITNGPPISAITIRTERVVKTQIQ